MGIARDLMESSFPRGLDLRPSPPFDSFGEGKS